MYISISKKLTQVLRTGATYTEKSSKVLNPGTRAQFMEFRHTAHQQGHMAGKLRKIKKPESWDVSSAQKNGQLARQWSRIKLGDVKKGYAKLIALGVGTAGGAGALYPEVSAAHTRHSTNELTAAKAHKLGTDLSPVRSSSNFIRSA